MDGMKRVSRVAVSVVGVMLLPMSALAQSGSSAAPDQHLQQDIVAAKAEPLVGTIPEADQPTDEQLKRLFTVMRLHEQMDTVMKQMSAAMQQQVSAQIKQSQAELPSGKALSPEQQKAMTALISKYMDKAMHVYPIDEMIADMSTIYKRHVSREDVDAIIAFYAAPAGQHLLEQQPAIMKEYFPVVMARVQERSKTLTDELSAEMKKSVQGDEAAAPKK
jgi:hypothetical protein